MVSLGGSYQATEVRHLFLAVYPLRMDMSSSPIGIGSGGMVQFSWLEVLTVRYSPAWILSWVWKLLNLMLSI